MINHEWLPILTDLTNQGVPCVLVTVTEAKGSTPRETGTKMIVTAEKTFGTIGGGTLEFQATDEARKLLQENTGPQSKNYPLGPKLAQCCGGAVTIFLEPFINTYKTIYLFGAGHVGKEVVKVFEGLPVKIKWIDERAHEFPDTIPSNCEKIISSSSVLALPRDLTGLFIVVMTHLHELDYEIARTALQKGGFSYLGVIGSDTKSVKFKKRLRNENLDADLLTSPIGLKQVNGKHPRAIAISLAAEILSFNQGAIASKPGEPYVSSCEGCPNQAKCG